MIEFSFVTAVDRFSQALDWTEEVAAAARDVVLEAIERRKLRLARRLLTSRILGAALLEEAVRYRGRIPVVPTPAERIEATRQQLREQSQRSVVLRAVPDEAPTDDALCIEGAYGEER